MRITDWKQIMEDAYVYAKDGQFVLNLERIIPESYQKFKEISPEALEELGKLKISRTAFLNHLNSLCYYVDFFIHFYDEDKELPAVFLNLKNAIDDKSLLLSDAEFAELLYRRLLGGGLKNKIYKMVCEQLYIDVTISKTTGRLYVGNDDFTNADVTRLQAISMMMKIAVPILEHFSVVSPFIKTRDDKFNLIADVFKELFYGVGNVSDYELVRFGSKLVDETKALELLDKRKKKIDRYIEAKRAAVTKRDKEKVKKMKISPYEDAEQLYMKMYKYVYKRMEKHLHNNRSIWNQHAAFRGITENSRQDLLLDKYIFYDNFFKFTFNENTVSFLQSIVNMQLNRTVISVKYKKDPIQIDFERDTSKYSPIDRFEETLMKMDENKVIRIDLSIHDMIQTFENNYGEISEEEIDYYWGFPLNENDFRNYFLSNLFANKFNGFTELDCMSNRDRIKLMIIGKTMLFNEGYTQLPHLLSSIRNGKDSTRILQNSKYIHDLEASPNYKYVIDNVYPSLKNHKNNMILEDISKILNNMYCYVEYRVPEITGQPIVFDRSIVSNEYLNYLLRA